MQDYYKLFSPIDVPEDILCLDYELDTTPIKDYLSSISVYSWIHNMYRQVHYYAHKKTQTVFILWPGFYTDYFCFKPPYRHPTYYDEVMGMLENCIEFLTNYYDGVVYSIIFAKLKPQSSIPLHIDRPFCLKQVHRVHIPIITNEKVMFSVSNKKINMEEGCLYEINNATEHGVDNNSDLERIHIIIDIVEKKTIAENKKIKIAK